MDILICDDDKIYTDEINKLVKEFMIEHNIKANIDIFNDGTEALEHCDKLYDIAILDIKIGNIKGTDIASHLKCCNRNTIIIIITANSSFLDEAMDIGIIRYMLKPLDTERLYQGLEKAISLIKNNVITFFLKKENKFIKVYTNDIIYVEIINRKTKIVTISNEYFSEKKIDFWDEKLKEPTFFKVHSSFIININYITKYERDLLELNNSYKVPISYRKQKSFRNHFFSFLNNRE